MSTEPPHELPSLEEEAAEPGQDLSFQEQSEEMETTELDLVESGAGQEAGLDSQQADSFSYVLPEVGTHWTQVRAFLLEVEADRPPDLAAIVRAVKARFPTYGRIQVEADRILSSLEA